MRSLVLLIVSAGCLAAIPAPAVAAGKSGSPAVALQQCSTGPAADDRGAVFVGRMRAVAGAARLQLRFILQSRRGDRARWATVAGQPLGSWTTADPGVRGYVFTKRVERLSAPGAYRVVVDFRWLSADGDLVQRARRTSPACRQSDFRPNLRPLAVEAVPAADGSSAYRVTVANDGAGASAPFELTVRVGGQSTPSVLAPGIAADAAVTVEVGGPACLPGGSVEVLADPASIVAEQREGDNLLRLPCPPAVAPPTLY